MKFEEIEGDLIALAQQGKFDVITHGCNCFCIMGAGIAPLMAKAFGADTFHLEGHQYEGDFGKLGNIDVGHTYIKGNDIKVYSAPVNKDWEEDGYHRLAVVNSYSQFALGRNHADGMAIPLDYDALRLCLRKINHRFIDKHIGLPLIGCGLAGGDWKIVKQIMLDELKNMDVTVVHFKK